MKKFLSFFLLLFIQNALSSQTIYVGQPALADLPRIAQLQGKLDKNYSFTVMPNIPIDSLHYFDPTIAGEKPNLSPSTYHLPPITFHLLPITFQSKFNSHHPYGWNDAGMLMAKGLQTQLSAGVYAKVGPITIQLRPEFVWAANSRYDTTANYGAIPRGAFNKIYGGQSSVFLNALGMGLGVSTENLWWGPGQFSSLLMSNNAPGFLHIRFQSNKPIKTFAGHIEWQLIGGRINHTNNLPFENAFNQYRNVSNSTRYINGFIFTWKPKFLQNLYIGATATQQLYTTDLDKGSSSLLKRYLPVFFPGSSSTNLTDSSRPMDGQFSIFSRILFPKIKAEFYGEFGYNDFKQNLRDFAVNPSHSAAWIIGMKKVIELNKSKRSLLVSRNSQPESRSPYLDIAIEATHMAQTTSYVLRNSSNWYIHDRITQGLTHQNQLLGAGSGLGNNVQTLQVRRIEGLDIIGIKLQRIQQDPKGVIASLSSIGMRAHQWTDISLGFVGQKKWNKIVAGGELQFVSSKNYGWRDANAFNLFFTTHVSYFF